MERPSARGIALIAVAILPSSGGFAAYRAATQPNWYGTQNPPNVPAGGISKEMAIDAAGLGSHPDVWAVAEYVSWHQRWVWWVADPLNPGIDRCSMVTIIDFFTGEQLESQMRCAD